MNEVLRFQDEREDEFRRHLSIARMLQARVVNGVANGDDIRVEVRHVNTIKSGLVVHLYNIVEAITTQTLTMVGQTVVMERPGGWTEAILQEWVRAEIWRGDGPDAVLNRLTKICSTLVSNSSQAEFVVKGEPGSWDDTSIKKVAKRLGCKLTISRKVRRAAYEKAYKNKSTALTYLARRRKAIAHGACTFEDGAYDLTLDEIEALAGRVLPFLRAVSESYQTFLENKKYLTEVEVNA